MSGQREASRRTLWGRAIAASDLHPHAKLVALIIGTHMDLAARCWLSYRTISDESSLSRSPVIRWVKAVEAAGLLEIEHGGGGRSTNRYRGVSSDTSRGVSSDTSSRTKGVSSDTREVSVATREVSAAIPKVLRSSTQKSEEAAFAALADQIGTGNGKAKIESEPRDEDEELSPDLAGFAAAVAANPWTGRERRDAKEEGSVDA